MARQLRPINPLEHSCPITEHGPGIDDCVDGGGLFLKKDESPTPLERLCEFRYPGRVALNSTFDRIEMKPNKQEQQEKASGRPVAWQQLNRKQRREWTRKIEVEEISLQVVHPDAAGIDIGNEAHYVAVPPSRDNQPVRRFGCTTAELKDMAAWLRKSRIRTIATQSTGVYWIAVYDLLEEAGFEVYLVNAQETKNLPGRKDRRAGEPVADEAAHLWIAAKLVSAVARNSKDENVLEATE